MAKNTSDVNITPLRDRALIRLEKEETEERETEAGIIIPETATEEDNQVKRGEVVSVGDGTPTEDGEIRSVAVDAGDTVLFTFGRGLTIEGEEYYIVNESNILAVVN